MQTNPDDLGAVHPSSGRPDAIELLKDDHRRIEKLFSEYEALRGKGGNAGQSGDRQRIAQLAQQVAAELSIHAQLEETLFYPALQQATGDARGVEQAHHDHDAAKRLLKDLSSLAPGDGGFDSTMTSLAKAVREHVRMEEETLFTEARGRLDAQAIGAQLDDLRRKIESPPEKPEDFVVMGN